MKHGTPVNWRARHRDNLSRIHQLVDTAPAEPSALTPLERLVIVLEDRRYFRHPGVDVISVIREISRALTFQKFGGASTIEMQFVRTVTGFRRHTMSRKLYEALLAVIVQCRYRKLAILRSYMACAFFGSGLIGADAAARKLFGKDASRLALDEAAVVAAMLAPPRPLAGPPGWEAKVRRRAAYGLRVYESRKPPLTAPQDVILDA
jgi:membrane peptidoglycan carboxypeptidase